MLLSVIIVNYNVKYFLEQCLCSVRKAMESVRPDEQNGRDGIEVIVIDNKSTDGSLEYLTPRFPFVRFISNTDNTGYAKANNQGLREAKGKYVLFLNPDTILPEDIFDKAITFFEQHPDAGALGVHMVDGSGRFLKESKRGLPTAWASWCKMSGLTTMFPSSKLFAGYYMGHLNESVTQEVEVLAGAFLMARRDVLQQLGGFDERFFMYAEDIDLSYRIMQAGYKNYYFADVTIIHFKGESTRKDAKYVKLFYKAMHQFVEKHYRGAGGKIMSVMLNAAIRLRTGLALVGKPGSSIEKKGVSNPYIALSRIPETGDAADLKDQINSNTHKIPSVQIPSAVVLYGDPDTVNKLSKRLQRHNVNSILIDTDPIKECHTKTIIFSEGKEYSFKSTITAIYHLIPGQKALIHACGSGSVVGSFDKDAQGFAVGVGN